MYYIDILLFTILLSINVKYTYSAVGSTCTTKADCGTGFSCILLLVNGNIQNTCIKSCTSASDCDGGTCDANPSGDGTDSTDKMCSTAVNPTTQTCVTGSNTECTGTENICSPYDLSCQLANITEACTTDANCVTGLKCYSKTCQNPTTTVATTTKSSATTVGSSTCVDLVTGGSNDCASLKNLCTNTLYISLMKQKCPKTCGYCTSSGGSGTTASTCKDLTGANGVSNCASTAYLCQNTVYKDLMKTQCPKTCGYC
uniref:ShKT domain-containing protein n=1 Tax=Parastrongyloides trichosuri TaxID=131310 RepID=A0A0N4ZVT0_PARTI